VQFKPYGRGLRQDDRGRREAADAALRVVARCVADRRQALSAERRVVAISSMASLPSNTGPVWVK